MILKSILFSWFLVLCFAEDEGDSCTEGGRTGTCVIATKCQSAMADIKKRKFPKICGFKNTDAIVCCFSNSESTTILQPIPPPNQPPPPVVPPDRDTLVTKFGQCQPIPAATEKPTGQKAFDKCIEYQEKYVYPCTRGVSLLGTWTRHNNCHHNADELILGGKAAARDEFPHMSIVSSGKDQQTAYAEDSVDFGGYVAAGPGCLINIDDNFMNILNILSISHAKVMVRYGFDEKTKQYLCGGSIISESYILTAAHCIEPAVNIDITHVIVGALTVTEADNKLNRYTIAKIIKHPGYNPPERYNDIALLLTERPIKLSHLLVPACLHTGDPVDDDRVLATGWGQTRKNDASSVSETLQKICPWLGMKVILSPFHTWSHTHTSSILGCTDVLTTSVQPSMELVILYKFNKQECDPTFISISQRYLGHGVDYQTQSCYGHRNESADTCQGDSGGPIQIKSKRINCMYIIVGLTSFGKGCGYPGDPALYTKLANYVPWIESIVWP